MGGNLFSELCLKINFAGCGPAAGYFSCLAKKSNGGFKVQVQQQGPV